MINTLDSKPVMPTGQHLFTCKANPRRQTFRLVLCAALIGMAIMAIGGSTGGMYPSMVMTLGTALGAAILLGPFILPIFIQYLRLTFRKITIYEDGVTIKLGTRSEYFQWTDIDGLSLRRIQAREIGVVLYRNKRQLLTINQNYQYSEILTKAIVLRTAESLINRYLDIYRKSGAITIGSINLSISGVTYRKKLWSWENIYQWKFVGNNMAFYESPTKLSFFVSLRGMTNAYLLPWLLDRIYAYQHRIVVTQPEDSLPELPAYIEAP